MPTANIFYGSKVHKQGLLDIIPDLRNYLAAELSCTDRKLTLGEISVRLVNADMSGTIGQIEMEIKAFSYSERVEKQDEICRNVRAFILKKLPSLKDIQVWLILAELGHSWEE